MILALLQVNADGHTGSIFASLHLADWISIGIGVLGILVGIVFALRADKKIEGVLTQQAVDNETSERQHKEEMEVSERHHAAQMKALKEQIANKLVARFPFNLGALTELISQAERDLLIMVDSLGYALYSNPDEFGYYIDAIEGAMKRGCKIRFVLYSLDTLREAIARQIPPGTNYRDVERHSKRCALFFENLNRPIPESYEEFRDSLLEQEQELMARFLRQDSRDDPKVEVRVVSRRFSAFCWLSDGASTALFAFRNDGLSEGGLTFLTVDRDMTGNFRAMFESEWDGGSKALYRERW